MPRAKPESINRLPRVSVRALEDLVQAQYAARAETDASFAVFAAETLGVPITAHNVAAARAIFDIPSTRDIQRGQVSEQMENRVARLEKDLKGLKDAFEVFKHGCRGDK